MSNQNNIVNHLGQPSRIRLKKKNFYEKMAWKSAQFVCGIDEVGRGCLAGPVVAAAAIFKKPHRCSLIKDSKLLSSDRLEAGYAWIAKHAWFGVGIVNHSEIDRRNIYQATLLAMNKAIMNVCTISQQLPAYIVVDAMPLNLQHTCYKDIPLYSFPQGETYSSSIAAASIVAKVTRDRLMRQFSHLFPGYHFEHHKGYGTAEHQESLQKQGRSLLHRVTFLQTVLAETDGEQQTLC